MTQQTTQTTELALLVDSKRGEHQRKRNRRADIKATKRMAVSTETQRPHVHAWRREVHAWRVQGEVCAPITVFVVVVFCCFLIY